MVRCLNGEVQGRRLVESSLGVDVTAVRLKDVIEAEGGEEREGSHVPGSAGRLRMEKRVSGVDRHVC